MLSTLRFHGLFLLDHFAEAIAQRPNLDSSAALYAAYRLGMYRSVAAHARISDARSAIASIVSLAACGESDKAAGLCREAMARDVLGTQRVVLADALAPYMPRLAHELLRSDGNPVLQAALAACHARARTAEETDWQRIVTLYAALAEVAPSPIVELNRAVAVGMAEGPVAGLVLVDALAAEPALADYHLLPSVRGDLLKKLGRHDEARRELERAASMTHNARERALLLARAAALAEAGQRPVQAVSQPIQDESHVHQVQESRSPRARPVADAGQKHGQESHRRQVIRRDPGRGPRGEPRQRPLLGGGRQPAQLPPGLVEASVRSHRSSVSGAGGADAPAPA